MANVLGGKGKKRLECGNMSDPAWTILILIVNKLLLRKFYCVNNNGNNRSHQFLLPSPTSEFRSAKDATDDSPLPLQVFEFFPRFWGSPKYWEKFGSTSRNVCGHSVKTKQRLKFEAHGTDSKGQGLGGKVEQCQSAFLSVIPAVGSANVWIYTPRRLVDEWNE